MTLATRPTLTVSLFTRLLGVCIISALLLSCDEERVEIFSEERPIDMGLWPAGQEVEFSLSLQDTTTAYDFLLLVDNTEEYDYRNMYVFVNMKFPNDRWMRDTVEFYLTDPEGYWLGESEGDHFANEVLYKYKRKLPLSGDYLISIGHGMREEQLQGVPSIGIRIVESK